MNIKVDRFTLILHSIGTEIEFESKQELRTFLLEILKTQGMKH